MTPRSLTIWYRFDCLILVLLSTIVTSSFGAWDLDSELSLSVTGPQRQTFTPSGNSSLIAGDLVRMTTFHFSGNTGQYAEFPTWKTPIDGNMALSFQFRTKLGDAFLMYLDDGDSSFIAITLYQRSLRLRFKFGLPRTVVLTLGNNMNDNRWHTVQVEKSFPSVRFTVDGNVTSQSVRGEGQDLISTTPTFFGGLTGGYEISQLALPSVFFENRFSGYVRQISINGKYVSAVRKYDVLEQTLDDACTEFRNPCQNNGVCYVSDQDTSCDCSGTSFAGQYCEEPYNQAVATFTGEEWFKYELSNRAVSTFQDKISLFFRTTQPNGLLFHTGKSADFVSLSLANGIVQVALNLGAGAYTIDVEKPNSVFNDDKWHRVQVNRSLSEVRVIVDDIDLLNNMEQEDFRELTLDNAIYVGGSPDTANLPGTQFSNTNFVGCLKEVTYVSDRGIPLAISRMAESRHPDVTIHGDVDFTCTPTNLSLPVSFARPESYITIPSWSSKTKGSIEFNFRTKEQNGLLIFGQGNASDLFAVEMYRGQLALVIDLGSQTARFLSYSTNRMYDGKWHHVRIIRMGRKIVFNVDGVKKQHMILGTSTDLDLSSSMTVGGSDFGSGFQQLRGLFTSPKRQGFVGCIQNMIIDKDIVDLRSLAQSSGQNMGPSSLGSGDITAFCGGLDGSKCASNPCMNGARCTEGMNRFICDCSNTSYRGKTCENAVMSATFDGTQYMGFEMEKSIQTDGEDISMRFKTPLKSGVLFATVSRSTRDMMRIEMEGGRLKLTIDLDCSQPNCTAPRSGPDTMYSETMLNDRKWHSVKLTRRGHRITFGVDGRHKGKTLGGRYTKLEFDAIYLGRIVDSNTTQAFAGTLQNVVFNSNFLIDSCFNQGIPCNHNVTWGERYAVAKPVTFRGSDSYIAMNTLSAYRTMSIFLSIKTTVTDGLILYNGGNSGDFMAVEIYGGKLMYIFNLGNGPQVLTVNGDLLVNDNSWHDIRIERSEDNIHTLTVDKQQVIQGGRVGNKNLDLGGKFYIGGVPGNMYQYELPDRVASRTGYEGCMGSLEVNGVSQDMRDPRGKQTVGKVNPGCLKPSPACTPTTCSNGGVCIQHWDGFKCDCSLTSYVGRLCQQQGHSYRIGSGTGLILYKWRDDYPSTRTDKLGLGFSTSLRNCVLLRVSGYTNPPTQDYLQLSIVSLYVGENCSQSLGHLFSEFQVLKDQDCPKFTKEHISSSAYLFNKGLITCELSGHSVRYDVLNIAFASRSPDAVLLTVYSAMRNPRDYLRLSIENGKLTLRFNVGGGRTVELREERSVSDGSYHTVQVRRRWLNATMRVNNWPVRSITPSGDARSRFALASPSIAPSARPAVDSWLQGKERVASVFNSQSTIQIGGLLSESAMSTLQQPTRNRRSPDITQPFVGQMMGLFFNDVRVFDLAARNDDRVQFYGDVTKIGGPDISPTNPTISQPTTTMATLTIFSTTKSTPFVPNGSDPDDCDDEDMCPNSSGSGSGIFIDTNLAKQHDVITSTTTKTTTTTATSPATTHAQYGITGGNGLAPDLQRFFIESGFFTNETPSTNSLDGDEDQVDDVTHDDVKYYEEEEGVYEDADEDVEVEEVQMEGFDEIVDIFTSPESYEESNLDETDVESESESPPSQASLSDILNLFTRKEVSQDPVPSQEVHIGSTSKLPTTLQPPSTTPSVSNTVSVSSTPEQPTSSPQSTQEALLHPPVVQPNAKPVITTQTTQNYNTHTTSTVSKPNSSTHKSNPRILLFSPPTTNTIATSGEHTDQQPSYPIPTTAAADWTGSAGSDRTLTSVPVSTGSIRFDQAKVTSSPPPPNPPMTPRRSSTQPPAAFSVTYESNSSATSAPLPSVFVTNDVTETRSGGGAQTPDKTKRIKIPISPMGDNIINTSNTSSSPLDVTVDVGSNVTNSVYIGQATTVTTAMIAGIAAAAACCVLLLFYVMYRFKKRDSVTYNVDERERQYGAMPKKGKPVTPIKNGSMKRDAKSQKHDKDKEYYV